MWLGPCARARQSGDPATIAGYLGKTDEIDEALTKFAFAYSEQNDRDYDKLKKQRAPGESKFLTSPDHPNILRLYAVHP